jgi:hypothetical protein
MIGSEVVMRGKALQEEQRRRAVRTALVLGLIALAFYIGIMISMALR